MIDADRFKLDDNKAWMTVDGFLAPELTDADVRWPPDEWVALDRPCPFCEDGFVDTMRGDLTGICDECDGTGRHTFDIEVECWVHDDCDDVYSLSVSVARILPVESSAASPYIDGHLYFDEPDGITWIDNGTVNGQEIEAPVTKVGDWLIELDVTT